MEWSARQCGRWGGRKRKAETEEGQVRSGQQSRIGDLVTLVVVETLKRQQAAYACSEQTQLWSSRDKSNYLRTWLLYTHYTEYLLARQQDVYPYGITDSFYLLSLTPFDSYRHPYIRLFPGLEPCAVQQLLCSIHHSRTPLPPTIALVSPREPHWRALLVSVVLRMYRRHARTSQRLSSASTLPSRTYTLIQPSSTTNLTTAVYPPPSNSIRATISPMTESRI